MALPPLTSPLSDAQAGGGGLRMTTPDFAPRQAPKPAPVGVDYNTGQVFVNGFTFAVEDHRSALKSQEFLDRPEVEMPTNFTPLEPDRYKEYIRAIQDPSVGRLMSKNFGIGVDATQMLLYGAAQAAGRGTGIEGPENFGAEGVERNVQELSYNEPYQRRFTDIDSAGDAGEWFVANLGQMAPSIAETIIAAGIGAIVGTATGGPLAGTAGGAIAGLVGKTAAKKELRQRVMAEIAKKQAGQEFDKALLRKVGAAGGGLVGSAVNSYALGVGDIFTEGEAEGEGSVANALLGAFPYMASEFIPQLAALSTVSRGFREGIRQGGRAKRAGLGFAGGAGIEGGTEAFQEALVMGATGQLDFSNPEVTDRLIDAFAAGAGVGGPLGFISGGLGRTQQDAAPERPPIDTDAENADLLGIPQEERLAITDQRLGEFDMGEPEPPAGLITNYEDEALAAQQALAYWAQQVQDYQDAREEVPQQVIDGYRNAVSRMRRAGLQPDVTVQQDFEPEQPLTGYDRRTDLLVEEAPATALAEGAAERTDVAVDKALRAARLVENNILSAEQQQRAAQIAESAADEAFQAGAQAEYAASPIASTPPNALLERRRQAAADQARQQAAQARTAADQATQTVTGAAMRDRLKRGLQQQAAADAEQQLKLDLQEQAAEAAALEQDFAAREAAFAEADREAAAVAAEQEAVAAQQTRGLKKKLRKKNAVQKPSTEAVAEGEQTGSRSEAGDGDSAGRKPAGESGKAKLTRAKSVEPAAESRVEPVGKSKLTKKKVSKKEPAGPAKPKPADKQEQQPAVVEPENMKAEGDSAQDVWDGYRQDMLRVPGVGRFRKWENLPAETQQKLERMYNDDAEFNLKVMESIRDTLPNTELDQVQDALTTLDELPTQDEVIDATLTLLEMATKDGSKARPLAMKSLLDPNLFVENDGKSLAAEQVLEFITSEATSKKRGIQLVTPKGDATDRAKLLETYGHLAMFPEELVNGEKPASVGAARKVKATASVGKTNTATEKAVDFIEQAIRFAFVRSQTGRGVAVEDANSWGPVHNMAQILNAEGIDYTYDLHGAPLESWLDTNRKNLRWVKNEAGTHAFLRSSDPNAFSLTDIVADMDSRPPEGRNFRIEDGVQITQPISVGRAKMYLQKVRRIFKNANVRILQVKNLEELRTKYPQVFKEAAAARRDGTFETTRAAGYSYGNTVIVFTDNIKGITHLAFIVAHEVIGHHGMRSVFPHQQFRSLMDRVYAASAEIRTAADRYQELHGVDKYEAIEEAIADYAAWLDNSVMGMLRKAFRWALEKLGLKKFDDELVRYMVHQSRRYVREGQAGLASAQEIANSVIALQEKTQNDGRFYRDATIDKTAYASQASPFAPGASFGLMGKLETYRQQMNTQGVKNFGDYIGRGLELIQSMSNISNRSVGLREVFTLFQDQTHYVRAIQAEMTRFMQETLDKDIAGIRSKISKEEKQRAGRMLAHWALYRNEWLANNDKVLHGSPQLYELDEAGQPVLNKDALHYAQMIAGYVKQGPDGKPMKDKNGDLVLNYDEIKAKLQEGITYQLIDDSGKPMEKDGKPVFETEQFENITDAEMRVFSEAREAIEYGALKQVESKLLGLAEFQNKQLEMLSRMRGEGKARLTGEDREFLDRVAREYQRLYDRNAKLEGEGMKRDGDAMREADEWLNDVTKAIRAGKGGETQFNEWVKAVNGQTVAMTDGKTEVTQVVIDAKGEYKWVVDGIKAIRERGFNDKQSMVINKSLKDTHLISTQAVNADLYARRTIMGAYVPFSRRGQFQVKVVAVDKNGDIVHLPEALDRRLAYYKVENAAVRDQLVADLQGVMPEDFIEVEYPETGTKRQVKLEVRWADAPDVKPAHEQVNYDEFVQTLTRLNVGLDPRERERVVEALTASHSTARRNLMRQVVPGWDQDVLRNVQEHLEMVAHISGKNRYRSQLRLIMDDKSKWNGEHPEAKAKLRELQTQYKAALGSGDQTRIQYARQSLDQYQWAMLHMTDSGATVNVMGPDGEFTPKNGKGQYRRHIEMANQLVDFYDNALDIQGDPVSGATGEFAGILMSGTAAMQLGMSIATAAINLGSLGTHAVPYLASYNPKNGYGGGFGTGRSIVEVTRATKQMSNFFKKAWKMDDPNYLATLEESGDWKKLGLEADEFAMIKELTDEGVLQANMFNAMIGTTSTTRKLMGPALEKWMKPFTYTEQLNRRATALAAYRLQRERMAANAKAQGVEFDPTSKETQQELLTFATNAVNFSQGEYAQYNRPPLARGQITQFLFMYKQFIVITIENLRNMGWGGTSGALAAIALLAGLKGMPFGEDLMDLVDTLAQKFELKMKPVEQELAEAINDVIPGAAPWVMNGIADQLTDVVVSSRIGLGDLVPLTGAGLAGSDPFKELVNFFGPVWSSVEGTFTLAKNLTQYGAESVGIIDDKSDLRDILRDNPIAGLRSLADAVSYMADGSVTNARGQIVSKEVGVEHILARMMGFYPKSASEQYELIRLGKQTNEYAKALKKEYVDAYVRAKTRGDNAGAREITGLVREWNATARGTPFYFRNFTGAANRAAKEAQRPAFDRFLRTTSTTARPSIEALIDLYGLNDVSDLVD